jgi:hypothetical protein
MINRARKSVGATLTKFGPPLCWAGLRIQPFSKLHGGHSRERPVENISAR